MSDYYPYQFWTRDDLYDHIMIQCDKFGFDKKEAEEIIYDNRWNPTLDFDGCTLVQDPIHPFYPCLKHDWAWRVMGGGIEHDVEFRRDLITANMYGFKAKKWFLGVRIAWVLWYKWKNKLKK